MCDAKSKQCYQNAERDMHGDILIDGSTDAHQFQKQCNCMHACTEFGYEFDIDRAKLLNSSWNMYHKNDISGGYGLHSTKFKRQSKSYSIKIILMNLILFLSSVQHSILRIDG